MVILQHLIGISRKPGHRPPHLLASAVGKPFRQQADVVAAHPQGGKVDPDDIDAVEEIAAEGAPLHHLVNWPRCGGDDTDIDGILLTGTDSPHATLLKDAEELRLERKG